MEQPEYAYGVFKQHFERARPDSGFVSLELGPGDSLFSAVVTKAFGGSESYLVDKGDYALKDVHLYHALENFLKLKGFPVPNISNMQSIEEILSSCSSHYLTTGLSSLRYIPSQSVDFIWSHAVLEHVRRADFLDIMLELRRIVRSNGICSHQIDLRDHLGEALNNLRFTEQIWESDWMANSGFYTNRIQYSQMIDLFQKANFQVKVIEVKRWDKLPTPKSKMTKEFKSISDEELCVCEFSVILKPI
jgi:SAM-dependent methyltransferase